MDYLCDNHPDILDGAIKENISYSKNLAKKLKKSTLPIDVSDSQAAEILHGQCSMSQRSYKNLKRILKEENVKLPKYETVVKYRNDLNVGNCCDSNCFCATTSLKETLQMIMSSNAVEYLEFKTDQQNFSFVQRCYSP